MSFKHKYCIKTRKFYTALFCNTDNNGIIIEEPDFSIGGTSLVNGTSRTREKSLSQGIIGNHLKFVCHNQIHTVLLKDKIIWK